MLQEAIKTIQELAEEASRAKQPRIVPIPGDPRNVFVDAAGTGGWEVRRLAAPKRTHKPATLEDLGRLALYAHDLDLDPAVWHSEDKVHLVFSQNDPWDEAILPLVKTPQWLLMEKLADKVPLRQRELITILRVELAGCIGSPRLLNSVSHVNFRAGVQGESRLEHGRESMGKSVESEVAGVKEQIPERETVRVPLYENVGERGLRWDIECDLEVNATEQVFVFRPLPGQLEEAVALHQGDIRQRLQAALGDDVPVYSGTP